METFIDVLGIAAIVVMMIALVAALFGREKKKSFKAFLLAFALVLVLAWIEGYR